MTRKKQKKVNQSRKRAIRKPKTNYGSNDRKALSRLAGNLVLSGLKPECAIPLYLLLL
jgi:hypothetical protein